MGPRVAAIGDRLAGADDLPAEARVVPIQEAPIDQIVELCAWHQSNDPSLAAFRQLDPNQYPESLVLMIGDRVIGFIVAKVEAGILHTPAWVVLPEYQRKRVGKRLLVALNNRIRGTAGAIQFDYTERATYTAKLAAEYGCEIVRIQAVFEREV
jgi:hypothetical protein